MRWGAVGRNRQVRGLLLSATWKHNRFEHDSRLQSLDAPKRTLAETSLPAFTPLQQLRALLRTDVLELGFYMDSSFTESFLAPLRLLSIAWPNDRDDQPHDPLTASSPTSTSGLSLYKLELFAGYSRSANIVLQPSPGYTIPFSVTRVNSSVV